jgi:hypothetical protein
MDGYSQVIAEREKRKQEELNLNPRVTPKRMKQYLMTWLIMFGKDFITQEESIKVDEAIGDDDEDCWLDALKYGYIYNYGYATESQIVTDKTRLTKKGITFINHGLQLGEEIKWQRQTKQTTQPKSTK